MNVFTQSIYLEDVASRLNKIKIMKLIGFDARVSRDKLKQVWPNQRRTRYLLNDQCEHPLSVDFVTWPSLFDNGAIGAGLIPTHKAELGLVGLPIPSWTGVNFPFWDNLETLRQSAQDAGPDFEIIKVYRCGAQWEQNDFDEKVEREFNEGWAWCGFDTADEGYNSCLTNTAASFVTDELRRNWSHKLNLNGLFFKENEALQWAQICNRELIEVPLLFVYALFSYVSQQPTARHLPPV